MTRQRLVILETLKKMITHPTADEVFEIVRKRLPRISLGTVYRNLDILTEQGLIIKLDLAGPQRRFDGNPERHFHLRCVGCGRVFDIPDKAVGEIAISHEFENDFYVVDYCLHFIGICSECRKKTGAVAESVEEIPEKSGSNK